MISFHIRIGLVAFFTFTSSFIFAQSMRYGTVASLQLSHTQHTNSRLGFSFGMKGELDFSDNENRAYLDFGLLLSAKGWKDKLSYADDMDKFCEWKCRLYYLEVPVHIGYKYALSEKVKLLSDIGPYFAVGLSGKSEFSGGDKSLSAENPYEGNLFKNDTYKRFDAGVGADIGVEIKQRLQIVIGYQMSLMNPVKERWNILSLKDRTLFLSFAYMF